MDYRISELMSGYEDDQIDLADKHITTAQRVKELTMGRIQPAVTPIRRGKKLGRTLLAAAVIVLALAASALAVYEYRIQDAEMELIEVSPLAETEETEETVYRSALSLNGFKDSPEYQAFVEWQNWNNSWLAENEGRYDELGVDDAYYETPENYAHLYAAPFQAQAEKLDEILEKYGLTAHTSRIFYDTESQLYRALGLEEDIFPDAFDIQGGYIYDDGSFKVEGDVTIDGEEVMMSAFHAVKGSFSVIYSNMPEEYEEWSYVTASGVEVILAVGEDKTYLIAGLDGAYMELSVYAALEREQAEALADSIGLTALNDSFATEKARAAVAASIIAFEDSRGSAITTDNMPEGADIVLAILGNYYLAGLPEGDYLYSTSYRLPDEVESDGCYAITHYYTGTAGFTLSYRTLQEGETALEFSSQEEQDMWGEKETACTVNGYDGILTEYNQGTEDRWYSVEWLDTDRELVFSVWSDNWDYTAEELLAYAGSVTAEDPDLETGAAAYAARIAQYQDEIDALTDQSWAEYEAYLAELDADMQEALDTLGDYDITALPADAALDMRWTNSVMEMQDWETHESYGYYLDMRKNYVSDSLGGNVNLTYERCWSQEDESVFMNERYFAQLLWRYGEGGETFETYTDGLSVNGYEAFLVDQTWSIAGVGIEYHSLSLYWYDTERELIFEVSSSYLDMEGLIALAESVAPAAE